MNALLPGQKHHLCLSYPCFHSFIHVFSTHNHKTCMNGLLPGQKHHPCLVMLPLQLTAWDRTMSNCWRATSPITQIRCAPWVNSSSVLALQVIWFGDGNNIHQIKQEGYCCCWQCFCEVMLVLCRRTLVLQKNIRGGGVNAKCECLA
jgi:hypothetical protein